MTIKIVLSKVWFCCFLFNTRTYRFIIIYFISVSIGTGILFIWATCKSGKKERKQQAGSIGSPPHHEKITAASAEFHPAPLDILSNYETDVKNIRESQKETGSALEQAQKYIDELKSVGKEFSLQNIHEYAQTNYAFDNNSNDWYKTLTDSEYLTDGEKEEVREIYSEVSHKYNDVSWRESNMNRLDELLKKHEKAKVDAQKKLEEDNAKIANNFLGGKPFETDASKLTWINTIQHS